MKNTKGTKQAFGLSLMALMLCFTMLVGTTFAWFTDTAESQGNKIMSGSLKLDLELLTEKDDGSTEWVSIKNSQEPVFDYDKWEPGFTNVNVFKIQNEGSLALKWVAKLVCNRTLSKLAEVIDVYVCTSATEFPADRDLDGYTRVGTVAEFVNTIEQTTYGSLVAEQEAYLGIALVMQKTAGNEYQNTDLGGAFDLVIHATQLTYENDSFDDQYDFDAEYPQLKAEADIWDGSADISWYLENPNAASFSLGSAEQLAGLAVLTDGTAPIPADADISLPVSFAGKTVYLESDVDLYATDANGERISFDPIGDDSPFEGVFDGLGHTISNMYQSGWDFGYEWGVYGSIGLFGELKNATVKNLTVSGADAQIEGGDIGGITGSATGNCVFENVTIENSNFGTYNNGIGGIIGWSGAGEYSFVNVTIASDVVLGGLWGSFDSSIGGVVGQGEPGATYNFDNVNVACRLDAYNDVTASYQYYLYRMTGMLIGRLAKTTTIDGANYPDMSQYNINCKDVTVDFGDWMNYHYCYGFNGSRYTRVEAGYAYGGLDVAAEDHNDKCTDHMLCLPFNGLFGGDQYGVRPITEYTGVTVNYPASYSPDNG